MIKNKIQEDLVSALKARNTVRKNAINSLKTKITEFEKANGNKEASDSEIIKIVVNLVKQRNESAAIYEKGNRTDLVEIELVEAKVLEEYLPAKMSQSQIEEEIRSIIKDLRNIVPNHQALIGRALGTFNKKFQGQADQAVVKSVIEKEVTI